MNFMTLIVLHFPTLIGKWIIYINKKSLMKTILLFLTSESMNINTSKYQSMFHGNIEWLKLLDVRCEYGIIYFNYIGLLDNICELSMNIYLC